MRNQTQIKRKLESKRKDLQRKKVERKTCKYVLNCFKRGNSIDYWKTQPHKLENFLVDLDRSKYSLNKIQESLDSIEYQNEWLFVVGDYGSGKSQLKNRVNVISEKTAPGILFKISANLLEDSLDSFYDKSINELKDFIMRKHNTKSRDFEETFEKFNKKNLTKEDKKIIFIDLIKIGLEKNLYFLLQFDEIDQISDHEVFYLWSNLFVSLSNIIAEGMLIIIYIAEREINRLWKKDKRLVRLDNFLLRKLDPGTRYETKLGEGIINLMSIYEIANNCHYSNESIEMMEKFIEFQYKRLRTFSLRSFNGAVYLLCDLLNSFEKQGIRSKIVSIEKLNDTEKGQKAEEAIIEILEETIIMFTVDKIKYSAEFLTERIRTSLWISDGKVKIYKEEDKEKIEYLELPIEVKYTKKKSHEINQIKDIKKRAKDKATILISIGPDENGREDLRKKLSDEIKKNRLGIIDVDSELFQPAFVYLDNKDYELKQNLKLWLTISTRMNTILKEYFQELTANRMSEEIEELKKEIKRIKTQHRIDKVASKGEETKDSKKEETKTNDKTEIAVVLIALFNKTKTGKKQKRSLTDHVSKGMKKPIENYNSIYSEIMTLMINNGFLIEKGTSYVTTEKWDESEIMKLC